MRYQAQRINIYSKKLLYILYYIIYNIQGNYIIRNISNGCGWSIPVIWIYIRSDGLDQNVVLFE